MFEWIGVEDDTTADGFQWGIEAEDKAVACLNGNLFFQSKLSIAAFSSTDAVTVKKHNLTQNVPCTVIQMQAGSIQDLTLTVFQDGQLYVDHHGGVHRIWNSDNITFV